MNSELQVLFRGNESPTCCEAHAGVEANTILDTGHGGTTAQVTDHSVLEARDDLLSSWFTSA